VDVKLLGTDVENISIEEESDKAMKVIEEGQLLIIYKGNKYNILGNR
jgi:hypothetical protein